MTLEQVIVGMVGKDVEAMLRGGRGVDGKLVKVVGSVAVIGERQPIHVRIDEIIAIAEEVDRDDPADDPGRQLPDRPHRIY